MVEEEISYDRWWCSGAASMDGEAGGLPNSSTEVQILKEESIVSTYLYSLC